MQLVPASIALLTPSPQRLSIVYTLGAGSGLAAPVLRTPLMTAWETRAMRRKGAHYLTAVGVLSASVILFAADEPKLEPLFPKDGPVTAGWHVGHWADVTNPPEEGAVWEVRDGVLLGGKSKSGKWVGTWLLSEREYGDFILDVEFKFKNGGEHGNGGIALRAPLRGDPAYDGFELQITDPRYETALYPHARPEQLTGALYLVKAPDKQMLRAAEWNHYRIELRGPHIKAWLNGEVIQDVDVSTLTAPAKRHGKGNELIDAPSGAERPRHGHIGFQDLSEDGEMLMFRNPRLAVLD
jgi:hypothetical protein